VIISPKDELFAEEIASSTENSDNDQTSYESDYYPESKLKIAFQDDEKSLVENVTDMNDRNIPAILRKMMNK